MYEPSLAMRDANISLVSSSRSCGRGYACVLQNNNYFACCGWAAFVASSDMRGASVRARTAKRIRVEYPIA